MLHEKSESPTIRCLGENVGKKMTCIVKKSWLCVRDFFCLSINDQYNMLRMQIIAGNIQFILISLPSIFFLYFYIHCANSAELMAQSLVNSTLIE